ncbi:MAG: hypothetical protein IKP42_03780 [Ruminococcus sp.]|nr:hypothetical protein [Ruminococcus sp.]
MNKFYMNGKLIHKASDHNTKRCEVEKWVFLPHSDFERLKAVISLIRSSFVLVVL